MYIFPSKLRKIGNSYYLKIPMSTALQLVDSKDSLKVSVEKEVQQNEGDNKTVG